MARAPRGPTTLHEAFDLQAAQTPAAIASICVSTERLGLGRAKHPALSYRDLQLRSEVLAAALAPRLRLGSGCAGPLAPLPVTAVRLPRASVDFLPLLLALSRVGSPFVLLSTDLPDKGLETSRNAFVLRALRPRLLIVAPSGALVSAEGLGALPVEEAKAAHNAALEVLPLDKLVANGSGMSTHASLVPADVLCVQFTGGTQRTKAVQVTHDMFLHERVSYQELWRPRPGDPPPVILAHTSVYWAASALGQLSISLAYGGTVVWCEAPEVADLHRCISELQVTIIGLVPDHLDLLAPDAPARELPHVECVFTWGERLPRRLAERWRGHPKATLRELLIATEYWLALYADPLAGDGTLRAVRGADLLVVAEDGKPAPPDGLGELYMAGPMVTLGYLSLGGEAGGDGDVFVNIAGKRYFRTRDLVRRVPDGFVYKGRADMMAKHKGKWVDMFSLEDGVQRLDGVQAAKVVPDPVKEHFHAFVSIAHGSLPGIVIPRIREMLPPQVQLWVIPELPRHPVTRKVDVTRLLGSLPNPVPSWPYEGLDASSASRVPSVSKDRMTRKRLSHHAWALFALSSVVSVADAGDLLPQLGLATAWLCAVVAATREKLRGGEGSRRVVVLTAAWLIASLAKKPCKARFLRCLGNGMLLAYMWLAVIHADNTRHNSDLRDWRMRLCQAIMAFVDEIPMLKLGTFLVLTCGQHCLPQPLSLACQSFVASLATYGATVAWRRGRLLSWPIVFWTLGLGHQLQIECSAWLRLDFWRSEVGRLAYLPVRVLSFPFDALLDAVQRGRSKAVADATAAAPSAAEVEPSPRQPREFQCTQCGETVANVRWPALDMEDRPLCNACGACLVAEQEVNSQAWLEERLRSAHPPDAPAAVVHAQEEPSQPESLETPTAKRRRIGDQGLVVCDNGAPRFQKTNSWFEKRPESDGTEEAQSSYRRFDVWWWFNQTEEYFDVDTQAGERLCKALADGSSAQSGCDSAARVAEDLPPEAQVLCGIIAEIVPHLRPVRLETALVGLDSMRLARLAYAIKARLGKAVSMTLVRSAGSVTALLASLDRLEVEAPSCSGTGEPSDLEKEYAIWFSPGQYSPMGSWVLRSDQPIDMPALQRALARLCDRHSACRADVIDPMHYMSIVYDAAVLWSLYGPLLDASGFWPARLLRRLVSWALTHVWPRVKCRSRQAIYGDRFPEHAVPLAVVGHDGGGMPLQGQSRFENELKRRTKQTILPPFMCTIFEIRCYLVDVWAFGEGRHVRGRFAIVRTPQATAAAAAAAGAAGPPDATGRDQAESGLAYVDVASGEFGPLLGPASSQWRTPPFRFPALFYVPLSTGASVWIRLDRADELRLVYKEAPVSSRTSRMHHFAAYRAAPGRSRESGGAPAVVRFVSLTMYHSFSDGNSFMPLAQDLFALYDAERGVQAAALPPIAGPPPFELLQRRLMDTLLCRSTPFRSSLRGGLFRYNGMGYGYTFGFESGIVGLLERVAAHYRIPFDVVLLGLTVCSIARADRTEIVEFTLYTPMRDGTAESMMIGLFSDWRDMAIGVDFEMATVLGTLLQLYHAIQHRDWKPFNALRKPERTVVNMQPLDMERRSHFQHLGENLWVGGDRFKEGAGRRHERMDWGRQPLTLNLEQQDESNWWILVDIGYNERPPKWGRCFSASLRCALEDLLSDPLAQVHRPFPESAWF